MGFRVPNQPIQSWQILYPVLLLCQQKDINMAVRPTETLPRASGADGVRHIEWLFCAPKSPFFYPFRFTTMPDPLPIEAAAAGTFKLLNHARPRSVSVGRRPHLSRKRPGLRFHFQLLIFSHVAVSSSLIFGTLSECKSTYSVKLFIQSVANEQRQGVRTHPYVD